MSVKRGQSFLRFPSCSVPSDYWQPPFGYSSGVGPQYFYHCAFWAACMLDYFGFLCAAEFTVPNLASFSPAIYLSVADISVDSLQLPACLCVRIKASKMDLFRQGYHIHIGLEGHLSAQFRHCWLNSPYKEMSLAPCSYSQMVNLCHAQSSLIGCGEFSPLRGLKAIFPSNLQWCSGSWMLD